MPGVHLENISIVLNRPRFPENIGSAARAMRNMGIKSLIVVEPENYDMGRILTLATHAAKDVVERAEVFDNTREALAPFNYVVGTTARLGGERQVVLKPKVMARRLVRISRENSVAVMFGSEDRGLLNEDIRLCHALLNIPTDEFSSLNLAQAVMVVCYELFNAEDSKTKAFAPRLASRHELDGMYDQVRDILVKISYINPENPDYWMNKIRLFLSRLDLRAREVSIIRGICRQIEWYAGKCYRDGVESKEGRDR